MTAICNRLMTRGISSLVLMCVLTVLRPRQKAPRKKHALAATSARGKPKPKPKVTLAPVATRTTKPRPGVVAKAHLRPFPVYDPTSGDNVDGDDLEVRRAAVEALGPPTEPWSLSIPAPAGFSRS